MKTQFFKRQSIRLKNFDYSSAAWYYVTICTHNRCSLFGRIVGGKMVLNNVGKTINQWWLKIPQWFKNGELDVFQIMPNHMHGIVIINEPDTKIVGAGFMPARTNERITTGMRATTRRATTRVAPTLGDIIGAFKSLTTHEYINGVKNHGWKPFHKRLWQRNYYEHVIRNQKSLTKIRKYIKINPQIWERDRNNPKNI